jgi:hypothetical protein
MKENNTPLKHQKPSYKDNLSRRLPLLIGILLTILPLLTYWQVQTFEFINMDDPLYITDNPSVRNGLSKEGIMWAFTFNDTSYWHPLTWLSHMVDCQLYWLNPQGHHFTNLFFHIASTLLLFLTLRTMTGTLWRSAFVAALFALHPLNVESVAWVANRKNILSAFFWILAMWSYAHYARKPNPIRYLMVFFSMLLGLLAKPTVVTLPFVFLLLDFWPLGRYSPAWSGQAAGPHLQGESMVRLILEKIPLIALSAVSVVVSFMSSRHMGIIIPSEILPLGLRIQNALASYLVYIEKMFLPSDLAVFYPFVKTMPFWRVAATCIALLTVTALAVRFAKKRPYFAVGWFWYLGTLVPVIGLVQQGLWPAFADRFAYIPLIGLFIVTVWGFSDLVDRSRVSQTLGFAAGSLAVLGMGIGAWVQTGYWKNSITLFQRAVDVTKDNHLAHYNLGVALYNSGRFNEGLFHCNEALRLNPDDENAHLSVGSALIHLGRWEDALSHFREVLRINPASATARQNVEVIENRLKENLQEAP